MKPLAVLLIVFGLVWGSTALVNPSIDIAWAARVGMSAMLVFTAMGHFVFTQGMTLMIPNGFPCKRALVFATGILEVALAVGISIPGIRQLSAWVLIAFLVVLLPANIKAAREGIDFQKPHAVGKGLRYLWFRIPLQFFWVLWTYYSCIAVE
ncbi:DoxX family protein [Flavobacterium sp. JP2137]|uniref:DoxX family protein n=1 Tax=Flavobacterium sp. JP2137 TaxID=3414510 RepID=UPI003D2FC0F3